MPNQRVPELLFTVLGTAAITIGGYLPWYRLDPRFDPLYPLDQLLPWSSAQALQTGFYGLDFLVLAVLGLVVVSRIRYADHPVSAYVTILGGLGISAMCLVSLPISRFIEINGMVEPTTGWYLTLVGAVFLILAGVLSLPRLETHVYNVGSPD